MQYTCSVSEFIGFGAAGVRITGETTIQHWPKSCKQVFPAGIAWFRDTESDLPAQSDLVAA
jgi:hypothetical protein